ATIEPTGEGKYHNALQAASLTGNIAIVKALLRRGFYINTTGGKFGTALTAAIVSNNLDIASDLIQMLQVVCIPVHDKRQLPADPLIEFAFY
ncbi:hypothetical protein N7445_011206, partial [Penicillium cf. griseofulvum]